MNLILDSYMHLNRVTWTSKASANQRAGRAGRTEPGHCYRYVYVYEKFQISMTMLTVAYF